MYRDPSLTWRDLLERSMRDGASSPHHRFAQLATVTKKSVPKNRTVVIRAVDDEDDSLLFCTDKRSPKVDQFIETAIAELCWYFTESREQYRIAGAVHLVTDQAKRASLWATLSPETRAQFFWPAPHCSLDHYYDEELPQGDRLKELIKSDQPAPYFLLCKLSVNLVDYLKLSPSPRRLIFRPADQGWRHEEVNP